MNIIRLDITNGLINHKIGAGEYIKLLSAPAAANVTVKPHNSLSSGVPLKVGYALKAKNDIDSSYISCDAIAGEYIEIMHADNKDPYILDSTPSSVAVDQIGGYESLALAQLDKIMNPYQPVVKTSLISTVTTNTTLLSKTLTSDKFKVFIWATQVASGGNYSISLSLDGVAIHALNSTDLVSSKYIEFEIDGAIGQTINITGRHTNGYPIGFTLQEYTLKP